MGSALEGEPAGWMTTPTPVPALPLGPLGVPLGLPVTPLGSGAVTLFVVKVSELVGNGSKPLMSGLFPDDPAPPILTPTDTG